MAKIHRIISKDKVDWLSIKCIASNTGTATYHLTKYHAKVLFPLSKSQYTVDCVKDVMEKLDTKPS